jgi:hypothetical protein
VTAPTPCDSCSKPIIFVAVANNADRKLKRMPLDAEPDPAGNVAVVTDGTGTMRGRVLGKGQHALPGETTYCPHFATCTHPEAHRRRQRGNWTAAVNARNADQRRRRTAPAQPDVLPGMHRIGGDR